MTFRLARVGLNSLGDTSRIAEANRMNNHSFSYEWLAEGATIAGPWLRLSPWPGAMQTYRTASG